jgi:alpha-tubulin suppressor-like RCC1 family protein
VQDLTLVPDISELFDEHDDPRFISQLQCGRRHCVATFDYGSFMFWGDNQVGQLGNRKRSFVESPYPHKKFEYRHNVENVVLGIDSSGVIVEDTGREKKKREKKKRILKMSEVMTNETDLKKASEAVLEKEEPKKEGLTLGERLRGKFTDVFYKKQ